jgi:P-type Cu+ transporter
MFEIQCTGMSCQGCVSSIRRLVQKKDPAAEVKGDPSVGLLNIRTNQSAQMIKEIVEEAGFAVLRLNAIV